jgi:hypothetical protein
LASISLDVAVGGEVVQDPAQVIFIISKNPYSTKPTVILNFSTPSLFLLWPTVLDQTFATLILWYWETRKSFFGGERVAGLKNFFKRSPTTFAYSLAATYREMYYYWFLKWPKYLFKYDIENLVTLQKRHSH